MNATRQASSEVPSSDGPAGQQPKSSFRHPQDRAGGVGVLIDSWKLVVLQRYAKFDGRARRPEFWWFQLANAIVAIILDLLGSVSSILSPIYVIYALAIIIPSVAVGIRRLHDTGRSGWWWLIALVPLVGPIVLLVFFVLDSTPGTNQYGVSEKYPTA
jgi:uncharacterized membrane protein YhaH (DUF805 family)